MTADSRFRSHEFYMYRCLELAQSGAGYVAPNPMVGAVLVHQQRIIGEGYHRHYGGPHAEVNCIDSVKEEDRKFIPASVMYVSLEPCSHFGKTPPCTDLIARNKIPEVVIGCSDPNREVSGQGIQKLEAAGVKVHTGILQEACREINKRFFTFHLLRRPYIILKWAETADKKIAGHNKERLKISSEITDHLVHRWRSEEAAILVGTNTALLDDPELSVRHWNGPSPVRLVMDMDLKLPDYLKLFKGKQRTVIFNKLKQEEKGNLLYYRVSNNANPVLELVNALYRLNIQSVLVEGGARLLQSFIDKGVWDEIRKIRNNALVQEDGLPAPVTGGLIQHTEEKILSDTVYIYKNQKPAT